MVVLQIVGYKNIGKTTLLSETVRYLSAQGYRVVTIKHHGHVGEDITLQDTSVDHMRHFEAGASQSIVQGHAYVQSVTRQPAAEPLEVLIQHQIHVPYDIVLVEGYKQAAFPKVIMYRNEDERQQLLTLSEVVCEVAHNEQASYWDWLDQWLASKI